MGCLLSVIVPVFNRELFVARCIESVLNQDCTDYELIVVNDASSDGSADVLSRYTNDRIRLFQHTNNQGVGPARNTAVRHARGEWAVFLDSDDELTEGGLSVIHDRLCRLSTGITGAMFLCKKDDGSISPDPLPKAGLLDFEAYITFMEEHVESDHDFLMCARVSSFNELEYPSNRGLEDFYHIEFHKRFTSIIFLDVVRLYHQDADNQLVKRVSGFDAERDEVFARDRADTIELLLSCHGDVLRRHAPHVFQQYASRLAVLEFLLGFRKKGLRFSAQFIKTQPFSLRAWSVLALGLLGRRPLLWAQSAKKSLSAR